MARMIDVVPNKGGGISSSSPFLHCTRAVLVTELEANCFCVSTGLVYRGTVKCSFCCTMIIKTPVCSKLVLLFDPPWALVDIKTNTDGWQSRMSIGCSSNFYYSTFFLMDARLATSSSIRLLFRCVFCGIFPFLGADNSDNKLVRVDDDGRAGA
jgi:hypothetical protein